jgi:alpha-glucosidase
MGALLPFCRNHNALHDREQEPWSFGEPFESAYRTAIEQRYRLLPYLYTLFQQAATTGEPIIRPLYYHYSQDEQVYATDVAETEFLVGQNLLTAPVYIEGALTREVYLPAGNWMSYWDGQTYSGGRWHTVNAALDHWPLFVRTQSILPLGPVMLCVGQHATDPLTLNCYMDEQGETSYTLYEDDGATLAYHNGTFAQTMITCTVNEAHVKVRIEEHYDLYHPQREWYDVLVHMKSRFLRIRLKAGQGQVSHIW